METIMWIVAALVWILFIGTVIKDYFQTQADKREVLRRDRERALRQ